MANLGLSNTGSLLSRPMALRTPPTLQLLLSTLERASGSMKTVFTCLSKSTVLHGAEALPTVRSPEQTGGDGVSEIVWYAWTFNSFRASRLYIR